MQIEQLILLPVRYIDFEAARSARRCICHAPITNGMCAKDSTHMYVARTCSNRMSTSCDLTVACFQSVKVACLTLELSDRYTDEQKDKLISKNEIFKSNLNLIFNPYQ